MRIQQLPVNQGNYEQWRHAVDVAVKVEGMAESISSRYPADENGKIEDHHLSDGVGPSIWGLKKEIDYTLQLNGEKQPESMDYRYQRTDHGYRDEQLRLTTVGDSKVYERRIYGDYGDQIFSQTQRVQVAPDGKFEYSLQGPDSKVRFNNWLRRNRSVEMLAHLGAGAAIGGGVGYALAGPVGGTVVGLIASAVAGKIAGDEAMAHCKSNPDRLEYKLRPAVDTLRTGINIGAAISGLGLVALLAGVC